MLARIVLSAVGGGAMLARIVLPTADRVQCLPGLCNFRQKRPNHFWMGVAAGGNDVILYEIVSPPASQRAQTFQYCSSPKP